MRILSWIFYKDMKKSYNIEKKNIRSKVIIWIQIALFATVVILTFLIGGYFQIQTRHDKEISENIRLQDEVRKLEDRLFFEK